MRDRFFRLDHRRAPGLGGLWGPGPAGGNTLWDMSGRGNHSDVISGPTWAASPRGMALEVSGVDQSVTVPDWHTMFPLSDAVAHSFCCWVRLDAAPTTYATLVNISGSSVNAKLYILLRTTTNRIYNYEKNYASLPTGWNDGEWHHAGYTHKAGAANADDLFFWDGVALSAVDQGGDRSQAASALRFGAATATTHELDGALSDMRLYYDYALSAAQMNCIYQKSRPNPYSDLRMPPTRVMKAPAAPSFVPYPYPRHNLTGGLAT